MSGPYLTDSVLVSIKKRCGLAEEYPSFDEDILTSINTYLEFLYQIGLGTEPKYVENASTTWGDLFGEYHEVNLVKDYIYIKVRLLFNPPDSSSVQQLLEKQASEIEWRINVSVDPPDTFE